MRKLTNDMYIAFILIIISGVVLWETSGLNKMSAVFPRTIGYILLVLSIIYMITSIMKPTYEKAFEGIDRKKVAVMSLGILLYAVLIWIFGFLIASLCYIFSFVWYLQGDLSVPKKRLMRAVVASIGVTIVFFIIFKFLLNVPLPLGLLFEL